MDDVSPETPSPYGDLWGYSNKELWYLRTNGEWVDCWYPDERKWKSLITLRRFGELSGPEGPWRRPSPEAISRGVPLIGPPPKAELAPSDRLVITHLKRGAVK